MRQNPHVRICGGPGSATTLVYPTSRSRWSSPAGQSTAPGSRMTWLNAAGRSRQQILSFMQYPVEICLNSLKI